MQINQFGPPDSPPPPVIPPKPLYSYIVDCLYSFTYVWPKYGMPFWFYPTSLQYGQVTGYLWTGLNWTFFGFDPNLIDQVACYPVPTLY